MSGCQIPNLDKNPAIKFCVNLDAGSKRRRKINIHARQRSDGHILKCGFLSIIVTLLLPIPAKFASN